MGNESKARQLGLVKRVAIDLDQAALEKFEMIAGFLKITRSEVTKRVILAALEFPLDHPMWQTARKDRVRKIHLKPSAKSIPQQSASA